MLAPAGRERDRILNAVHDVLRRAFGASVKKELLNYESYSTTDRMFSDEGSVEGP